LDDSDVRRDEHENGAIAAGGRARRDDDQRSAAAIRRHQPGFLRFRLFLSADVHHTASLGQAHSARFQYVQAATSGFSRLAFPQLGSRDHGVGVARAYPGVDQRFGAVAGLRQRLEGCFGTCLEEGGVEAGSGCARFGHDQFLEFFVGRENQRINAIASISMRAPRGSAAT
jgi:hypothetical protein